MYVYIDLLFGPRRAEGTACAPVFDGALKRRARARKLSSWKEKRGGGAKNGAERKEELSRTGIEYYVGKKICEKPSAPPPENVRAIRLPRLLAGKKRREKKLAGCTSR